MLIDLHMHEKTHSKDSCLRLTDMVNIAKGYGLQGICITDHDSMELKDYARAYSEKAGFPIFVGVEFYSLQGDIVAFGIDGIPGRRIDAQEFVDYVHGAGGVCFSAHPFRNNNRGLEENLLSVRGLDGIEAFNASTDYEANRKALHYCNRLGIQPLGTSDCHVKDKVGVFATRLPAYADTMEAFLKIFRMGGAVPVGYCGGKYVDLIAGTAPSFQCTVSRELHNRISIQQETDGERQSLQKETANGGQRAGEIVTAH